MKNHTKATSFIICLVLSVLSFSSCYMLVDEGSYHEYRETYDFTDEPPPYEPVPESKVDGKVSVYVNGDKPVVTVDDAPEVSAIINESDALTAYYDNLSQAQGKLSSYVSNIYCSGTALTICFTEESEHVNAGSNVFTFDINSGALLKITDILVPEDPEAQEMLSSMFAEKLSERADSLFVTPKEAVDLVFSDERSIWGIYNDGIYLRFAPFDIASYSLGYINVTLPYSDLDGIIKAEYMPENNYYTGDADLCDAYYIGNYSIIYGDKSDYGVVADSNTRDVTVYRNGSDTVGVWERGSVLYYTNVMTKDEFVCLPNEGGQYILDYTFKSNALGIKTHDGSLTTFGID